MTILSILTALGLAISTLILALTRGSSGGNGAVASAPKLTLEPASVPSKGGAKEWIKTKLTSLGRMLSWLGQKALSVLLGLIGTLVGWIFNMASSAVGWFAQNLWAFIFTIGSLLYLAAKAYITRKSGTEHHKRVGAKKKAQKN